MKAIVTGANGFIGSTLCELLVQRGLEVLAIDLSFERRNVISDPNIKTLELSVVNIETLDKYVENQEYDIFYHLAWAGVNGPEKADPEAQLKNIECALKVAKIAKKIGCKKVLFAGTVAEQSVKSLSRLDTVGGGMMYGVAKSSARMFLEAYCKNIGLDFVWMQFSNIYGPKNKTGNLVSYTITQLMNNEKATFGPAEQPYDFIYVDDLLEAVFRLGIKDTKDNFYYIGSGSPRILKEYLLSIGEACEKQKLIRIGERADDGIKYDFSMFDITPIVRDIGEYVSYPFEKGIRITIDKFGK